MRLNEEIEIVNHNPMWRQNYMDEVERLKKKAFLSNLAYEHIGSTSIPNIKAKPVVDIIIGVKIFPPNYEIIREIEESGYTFMQEMSVSDRLYFIKRGSQNFNLHIILYQGVIWNNDILFRNHMVNHPNDAQRYSSLKEQILSEGIKTLLEYSDRKANFILEIYEKMQ